MTVKMVDDLQNENFDNFENNIELRSQLKEKIEEQQKEINLNNGEIQSIKKIIEEIVSKEKVISKILKKAKNRLGDELNEIKKANQLAKSYQKKNNLYPRMLDKKR